jgi:hypothetical protein
MEISISWENFKKNCFRQKRNALFSLSTHHHWPAQTAQWLRLLANVDEMNEGLRACGLAMGFFN